MLSKVPCLFVAVLLILGPRICCVITCGCEIGSGVKQANLAAAKGCCKGCKKQESTSSGKHHDSKECPCDHWHLHYAGMLIINVSHLEVFPYSIFQIMSSHLRNGVGALAMLDHELQSDAAWLLSNDLRLRLSVARC